MRIKCTYIIYVHIKTKLYYKIYDLSFFQKNNCNNKRSDNNILEISILFRIIM